MSASAPHPPPIVVETAANQIGTVIWLHGLGADGNDFAPIVASLNISAQTPLRFIFPHAPLRAITINGGMEMRGWYDLLSMDFTHEQDRAGLAQSAANQHTPIFMAHGTHDPLIPIHLARTSKRQLTQCGYPVTWREYQIEHSVSPEEVADIADFLHTLCAPTLP